MNWCRTIPGFVRVLVALFLVAQFSGVVSSPRANAQTPAVASHLHHQHGHDHGDAAMPHDHGGANLADSCCGLHAYLAGILPPVIAIETERVVGEPLAVGPDDLGLGVAPGRLDRPPRSLR